MVVPSEEGGRQRGRGSGVVVASEKGWEEGGGRGGTLGLEAARGTQGISSLEKGAVSGVLFCLVKQFLTIFS